jgi:CheY-like chemotaxis protein/GAF domain-containing protein
VTIHPVLENNQCVELIALCDDVTDTVNRQQKLDALHQAGQELADLEPGQLSEMKISSRVELLKKNLRRHIHDLLHYDVIEIRLLDPITGKLDPLLEEGMTPEAANRVLYARREGNGVTGYVAATGLGYLCVDTANDPHYIVGASDARCSMTVPILYLDQVIGTFNVESPRPNAFTEDDLQFAELFSREIARALHTLNLLSAQQLCTAHQSIEAINREIALPADELLNLASGLIAQLREKQPESAEVLQVIMNNARQIKQSIQKVGDSLATSEPPKDDRTQKLKSMHILVIDSDENIRRSSHSILERLGCDVETAVTGQEGIAMAQSGKYEAILCDIRHPDMRGTVVYRTLKSLQPNSRIILTQAFGYDSEHTVVNARQDGYWLPVLFKPFRLDQLLNALTTLPPSGKSNPVINVGS